MYNKHLKVLRGVFEQAGFDCHVFSARMVSPPQQHKVIRLPQYKRPQYKEGDTITCPNCGMDMKASPKVIGTTEVLWWTCDPHSQCGYSFPAE